MYPELTRALNGKMHMQSCYLSVFRLLSCIINIETYFDVHHIIAFSIPIAHADYLFSRKSKGKTRSRRSSLDLVFFFIVLTGLSAIPGL
jgi:hypothetical protein